MDTILITKIVVGVIFALLIIYDIWVAVEKTKGDTISQVLYTLSLKNPVIPFALGFIMGHIFWK